jgi:succinyl-diaminopimelate desuccinylase
MLTDIEQGVLDCVDPQEVITWTQQLVRIPSVYRPKTGEGEEKAAEWIRERFQWMGLETHWEVVAPGRPNVIGLLKGASASDSATLMLEGHTDVVTEGDPNAWSYGGSFSAEIVDGRMYGRGASDMKGGLVAAMCAVRAIIRSGVRLKGDILIAALVDEEGLMLGVKHFVERGWARRVSAAIICEPEENHLCIAQKGVMWANIMCTGVMAHGAMPLTGVNSTYPMAALLTRLRELEAAEIARVGNHKFLGQPSITPTIIQSPVSGEPQNNVMPAQTRLTLDCRLIPGQTPEDLEGKVRHLFDEVAAHEDGRLRFDFQVIEARPPTFIDRDAPFVKTLHAAYRDTTGREPIYGGVPGTTDGTILFARAGVPVVAVGPGDMRIPHHINEWLGIDELVEATRFYAVAAMRFLGVA